MDVKGAKALSERLAEVGRDPGRDELRSEDPGSGSSSSCSDVLHDGEGESGDEKGRARQAVCLAAGARASQRLALARFSATSVTLSVVTGSAGGLGVGGDVEHALENVGVPSYVLDETGIVRWINAAAEKLLGDVRGRHFTSVVAPEDSRRARELFSQKVLGTSASTEATGVLVSTAGARVAVELSAVPLRNGERVVGVFGLIEEGPADADTPPPAQLTPRQVEVLRLLEQGRSTKQIAAELHLSTETIRNHIRRIFQALGVHSRLEAVAAARHV